MSFGKMTFVIDGIDYDLPSHHFIEKFYDVFEKGDSVCMSTISTLDVQTHENLFVLGDIFMQEFYTIFDRDLNRIGLAKTVVKETEVVY